MIFNAWNRSKIVFLAWQITNKLQSNWIRKITTQNLTVEQFHRVELKDDRRSNEAALEILSIFLFNASMWMRPGNRIIFSRLSIICPRYRYIRPEYFTWKCLRTVERFLWRLFANSLIEGVRRGGVLIALNDSIMDSFFVLAIGQRVFKKVSEKPAGYLNHIVTFYLVDRWHR